MSDIIQSSENKCPHCDYPETYMVHEQYSSTYLMHSDILQCPECRQYYWMTYKATNISKIDVTPTKSLDFFEPLEGDLCPDCGETLYQVKEEGLNYKVWGNLIHKKYCGNTEILFPTSKIIRESVCHYTDPRETE
jgi:uncharacterized protein with PIN domain